MAIDKAKDLGTQYPWNEELEKAEDFFYDMAQCPPSDFVQHQELSNHLN